MENKGLRNLIELVGKYDDTNLQMLTNAYNYAEKMHEGQIRKNGEAYIIHPLEVALILAEMKADVNTICAGLLHDTMEDTNATKSEIAHLFNPEIATLVDGVTKISRVNFSTKNDQNMANTRKIITSIVEDVRIIIIKLADRLHNMRTLQYMSEFKQKEISLETLEFFAPLAYYIGAYRIKNELEDLSLKHIDFDMYTNILGKRKTMEEDYNEAIREMLEKVLNILTSNDISVEIKIRTKNIYGIYKKIMSGSKLSEIHDLISLKVIVDNISDCYKSLGLIHSLYNPVNNKFKDYICNPKTNMYQSLHTTVFGLNERLIQFQIKTQNMDRIAAFGLATYWDINKNDAASSMQNDLVEKFQFFKSLTEINLMYGDNAEFVNQIKRELFSKNIYVYSPRGDIYELPVGSTVIDFAYKIHTEIGNTMIGAIINGEYVSVNTVLKNNDRIRIITDKLSFGPREEWIDNANTVHAKRRIKEFSKSVNCINKEVIK